MFVDLLLLPALVLLATTWFAARRLGERSGSPWVRSLLALAWVPALVGVVLLADHLFQRVGPLHQGLAGLLLVGLALLPLLVLEWGRRLPWTGSSRAVALAPLVVVVGAWFASTVGPDDLPVWLPVLAGGLVLAAGLAPAAASRLPQPWDRSQTVVVGLLVVPLVLGTVAGGMFLFVQGMGGQTAPQERAWSLAVEDREGNGTYTLTVPFPVTEDGTRDAALRELAEDVHVVEGDASWSWVEEGRSLQVTASGPVRLEASYAFFGPGSVFLTFPDWNVSLEADGARGVEARVHVVATQGGGHSCWTDAHLVAYVEAGNRSTLWPVGYPEDGPPKRSLSERGLQAVCV